MTKQKTISLWYYQWAGKTVFLLDAVVTVYKPLINNLGIGAEIIYISKDVINIKSRWDSVKRKVSIRRLETYCSEKKLENFEDEDFSEQCTR